MRWQTTPWIAAPSRAAAVRLLCATFLLATLAALLVGAVVEVVVALAVVAAACATLGVFQVIDRRALIVAAACAVCALAFVRIVLLSDMQAPFIGYFGRDVTLVGRVVQDPKKGESQSQAVVSVESINGEPASGRVLLFVGLGHQIHYLDSVTAGGRLSAPEPFETETGALFDYAGYLAAKGIGASMFRPRMVEVTPASCCSILGSLYVLKENLIRSIEKVFPEPHGGLMQGMLLGEQDALPEKTIEAFRRSSLVHVVVLSGYNLTIIAVALIWLLGRIPRMSRRMKFAVAGVGIVLFATMVGFSATVVRATIMALLTLVSQILRRPGAALHALIIAATGMVALNPRIVTDDPSFILSFLATFGLVTLSPYWLEKLAWMPERFGLREITAATLATQVFILPALIFYTGHASMVSLPANIVALPLVPPAMFLGAGAALVGLVSSTLASFLMLPAAGLLWLILLIAEIAASLPFASIEVSALQNPYIFCVYALLIPVALWSARTYTTWHGDYKRVPLL